MTQKERHNCKGIRKGDWIFFTCPQCDFQRKINWKTGEMKTSGGEKNVLHDGNFVPTGLQPDMINPN